MNLFRATAADVPRMMGCARDCCAEHGPERMAGLLDETHYQAAWEKLLMSGAGMMFLFEDEMGNIVGGVGAVKYVDMLTGKWRASQVFLYIRPEHRGRLALPRLIKAYEQWAVDNHCESITTTVHGGMPVIAGAVFERLGFRELETVFVKENL